MKAVNWNRVEDDMDLQVWNRLVTNFWLPEKIAVSNDINSWNHMTDEERDLTVKVFTGLTLLDTIQGHVGADTLKDFAQTQHEIDVLNYIGFNESVHAKSYSNIFSTLCTMKEIDAAYEWSANNTYLQQKKDIILEVYRNKSRAQVQIISTLLESFLFYSGFYLPLYWESRAKLTNSAIMIKLIIKDEAVHGYYIGYKFQQWFKTLSEPEQQTIKNWALDKLKELMEIEINYTRSLYSSAGLTNDVTNFLHYNANKAFMNLGFEPPYSAEQTKTSPAIITALSPQQNVTHDFFSDNGSSYEVAVVEATNDDDWDF